MTDDVALGSGNSPLHSCKKVLQFFSELHKFLLVTSHGWLAAHSTVGRVRRLWDLSCFAISRPSNSLRVKGWIPFQGPGQHREIGSCVSNIIQQLTQVAERLAVQVPSDSRHQQSDTAQWNALSTQIPLKSFPNSHLIPSHWVLNSLSFSKPLLLQNKHTNKQIKHYYGLWEDLRKKISISFIQIFFFWFSDISSHR